MKAWNLRKINIVWVYNRLFWLRLLWLLQKLLRHGLARNFVISLGCLDYRLGVLSNDLNFDYLLVFVISLDCCKQVSCVVQVDRFDVGCGSVN